jgi:tetratricopeptide (TPR) repeat protein
MVANDWIYGDGIDHDPLAKEAAEKALALDPALSMPYAVLGMYSMIAETDYITGLDQLRIAVEKDPNNTSAWLWQGIHTKQLGYFDKGIGFLEKCLSIDPAYENCRQHLAEAYLFKGMTDKALEIYYTTLESNFHSISDSFVSIMVRQGNRPLALTLADIETELDGAPVIEWIRAVEEPAVDHSSGLARMKEWSRQSATGIKLVDLPYIFLAFKSYDELAAGTYQVARVFWHPEAAEFRTTAQFKKAVRETGALAYYRAKGFPPQCRVTGDDFDCSD